MKKRLIYVSHWRFPSEKTMTPLILKTCEGFVNLGYEVELWVPRRHNESVGDPFEQNRIYKRFPIRKIFTVDLMHMLGRFGFLLMVASFNLGVFMRLRHERGVILYGHDLRDFILPSFKRLPLFIEIHDFYESKFQLLNRFVLKRTTGLIVTNSIKQRRLAGAYGYPLERMLRQPNAVDVAQFDIPLSQAAAREQLGLPQKGKIALYTGHLFGWKGVHTLAEAAPALEGKASVYFVGGTDSDRTALTNFITQKNLSNITFLPHQPHQRMPIFMKAADVLVLPNTAKDRASKYETSPVKLFEYLASGTPIVASDLPSIREVVSEKEVFFFEPDNPDTLAQTVLRVLQDSPEVEKRGEAAKALARQYSWESRANSINNLVRK